MPRYVYQASYTAESVATLINHPEDRIEAVTPAFKAMNAEIVVGGFPFGEHDILVIYDAPDDITAAALSLAIAAGGAVRSGKTTRLLTAREWVDSLQKAQGSQYKPAR